MTLDKIHDTCALFESVAHKYGWHVALTGGSLYKKGERKDLDIVFYQDSFSVNMLWFDLAVELVKELDLTLTYGYDPDDKDLANGSQFFAHGVLGGDVHVDLFFLMTSLVNKDHPYHERSTNVYDASELRCTASKPVTSMSKVPPKKENMYQPDHNPFPSSWDDDIPF